MTEFFDKIFFGRIAFSAADGFVEMFLNLCRENGIELKNVEISGGCITAEVRRFELKALFEAANKSGMTVTVNKRSGLPDIFIRYRKRLGIPVGILFFILIAAVLSSFVWSVDMQGLERIPAEDFLSVLAEAGVKRGALCEAIQSEDAELLLHSRFPELLWVNVNLTGSRIFVTAREREDMSFEKEEIYSNIIASKSGEIVRADIFAGDGKIYPGTAVVKGDLLVNGVITFRDGGVTFVDSQAQIFARTKNFVSSFGALEIDAGKTDGCKDRYLLYFFGLKIPLSFVDKVNDFTDNGYFLSLPDVVFPLGVIRQQYKSMTKVHLSLSEKQATMLAFFDFSKASFAIYEKTTVLERTIRVTSDSAVNVEGEYLCVEDIAEKKSFTVEQTDKTAVQ